MSFRYEERCSDSPYVEAIWRTEDTSTGTYLAAADGAWDMIFTNQEGRHKVYLSGPSSQATPIRYEIGNLNFGIRFRPGVFFTIIPVNTMLDITAPLPTSQAAFWLDGQSWALPNFDNADSFLEKLSRLKLIDVDPTVQTVLRGETPSLTTRSIQRRFLRTTGLPPRYHRHIRLSNRAVELLQNGTPILDVVHRLGYADQAHMTRVIKRLSGCTPGQIIRKMERARRLHSIQNYGPCAQMKVLNFNGGLYDNQAIQNKSRQRPTQRSKKTA
jgi:hypothetical protein